VLPVHWLTRVDLPEPAGAETNAKRMPAWR